MNNSLEFSDASDDDDFTGDKTGSNESGADTSSDDALGTNRKKKGSCWSLWCPRLDWSKDSMQVFFWMVLVMAMIGVTAAIVLTFTISFLTTEETSAFENGFAQQASVIEEATRFHAKTVVGSLEAMSDTITSYAGATKVAWPFLSVPDFDRRGQRARVEAYVEMIAFSPLVTYEDRHRWSIYSSYDSTWLGENGTEGVPTDIYRLEEEDGVTTEDNILMLPMWMSSPKPYDVSVINFNILSDSTYYYLFNAMTESKHTALSAVYTNHHLYDGVFDGRNESVHIQQDIHVPHSVLMAPVYDNFDVQNRSLTGVIHGILPWDTYLNELLPPGVDGIIAVLVNSCGQAFTFQIDGPQALFKGAGDLHDAKYDHLKKQVDFGDDFLRGEKTKTYRQCSYSLILYPSQEFQDSYDSNDTEKFTALLVIVFCCLAVFFFIFVWVVQRRQIRIMGVATRTTAIVSSLFPDNVRDRIMKQAEAQANREYIAGANNNDGDNGSSNLRTLLQSDGTSTVAGMALGPGSSHISSRQSMPKGITVLEDAPIADLYPDCTVLFADIVGFTAWSSTRDPAQVFVLLETLYGAFDSIAKRRRVFKVETIGDCYVAVTGLPEKRRDHAVAMARFAHDCLVKSGEVFHCLEVTLGPGTSRLNIRLGLHSGPVTAGVLRGEKGRFQLFGDTVNTAARMESNSMPGKIQCSEETSDLLLAAGKTRWVTQRKDKIVAKGKGELTTAWVTVKNMGSETHEMSSTSELSQEDAYGRILSLSSHILPASTRQSCKKKLSKQHARLVEWNVELLSSLLASVVASRRGRISLDFTTGGSEPQLGQQQMPFHEWSQSIDLPKASKRPSSKSAEVKLPENVVVQLRHFVTSIALLHGDNAFHNFDHASHVTMSVHKLLNRVIQSGNNSYRIASDPLTHFGAVMSALIHDVDHRGVPNAKLLEEDPELAAKYDRTSVAEQHAIDLAWNILMDEQYTGLRKTIYTTDSELKRFRMVLVNSVLSTDIVNKDLKELRNERWNLAFSGDSDRAADAYRASSVLEHLIQASDVSHTMQHWHIYISWNEKLFNEMHSAYKEGRMDKDPSEGWYEGELGFFDFYIIPLAKKLAEVGVFGVSSSEYLDFALKNRAEWESKGKDVVASYLKKVESTEKATENTSAARETEFWEDEDVYNCVDC